MDLRHVFDAAALLEMDEGMLRRDLENKIAAVIRDITGRPCNSEGKAERRRITLDLQFTPVTEFKPALNERVLTKIEVRPRVHTSLPKTSGALTQLRVVKQNGQLIPFWNPDDPADIDSITPPLPGMSPKDLE